MSTLRGSIRRKYVRPDAAPMRILVVEDDPADLRLIARALDTGTGPHVRLLRAGSLSAAVETLTVAAVSLVVLDLNLPESRGLETLALLRRRFPSVPIVVLTGDDGHELGRQCIAAGAQDFLTKADLVGPVLWRSIDFALSRVQRLEARADERLRTIVASLGASRVDAQTPSTASDPIPAPANGVRRVSLESDLGVAIARARNHYTGAHHQVDLGAARSELRELAVAIANTNPKTADVLRELLHGGDSSQHHPTTLDVALFAIELLGALTDVYRSRAAASDRGDVPNERGDD